MTPEYANYGLKEEHPEYFYPAALKAIARRRMSTVMLGRRRMGKTGIFKCVVNRLFFEQEQQSVFAAPPEPHHLPEA